MSIHAIYCTGLTISLRPLPAGMFEKKSMTKSQRVRLKGGAAVDADSGLEDDAHVYQASGEFLNVVLSMVDAGSGQNSYYRLQVLQSDYGNRSERGELEVWDCQEQGRGREEECGRAGV